MNFDVAANAFGAVRSGTIHVGDQVFIVTQAASTCAYVLTGGYAAMFGRLGSPNNRLPVSVQTMCGPPAVVVNGPPGMITLGSVLSPAPGMFTQNYDVSLYQTFINFVRTAQLLIQGQIFTVKQNSF